MKRDQQHDAIERLERYVDGMLDDAEREAFERELVTDVDLAEELGRQRALESRLSNAFTVPVAGAIAGASLGSRPTSGATPPSPLTLLRGIAAAAVVFGFGLAPLWLPERRPDVVAEQFSAPSMACSDLRVDTLARQYGLLGDAIASCNVGVLSPIPWLTAGDPRAIPGVDVSCSSPAGERFEGPLRDPGWPGATLVRATRADEVAVVLILPIEADDVPTTTWRDPVRVHRRELGAWALFELSTYDAPRFLPLFAEVPR